MVPRHWFKAFALHQHVRDYKPVCTAKLQPADAFYLTYRLIFLNWLSIFKYRILVFFFNFHVSWGIFVSGFWKIQNIRHHQARIPEDNYWPGLPAADPVCVHPFAKVHTQAFSLFRSWAGSKDICIFKQPFLYPYRDHRPVISHVAVRCYRVTFLWSEAGSGISLAFQISGRACWVWCG